MLYLLKNTTFNMPKKIETSKRLFYCVVKYIIVSNLN